MFRLKRIFLMALLLGASGIQLFDLRAAAEAPAEVYTPRLVARLMTPPQMVAAGIYDPINICGICQEDLGNDITKPIMAIRCSPYLGTEASGQHHCFHVKCIKTWWISQGATRKKLTCPLCERLVINLKKYKVISPCCGLIFGLGCLVYFSYALCAIAFLYSDSPDGGLSDKLQIILLAGVPLSLMICCVKIMVSTINDLRLNFNQAFNLGNAQQALKILETGGVVELN